MTYLFINTVNPNYASFAIFTSGGVVLYLHGFVDKQERLSKELDVFLRSKKIKPQAIKGVMIITGPGSFSASRAGVVLANAFNFMHKTPVLGVKDANAGIENLIIDNLDRMKRAKKTAITEVYYDAPPNITIKKQT